MPLKFVEFCGCQCLLCLIILKSSYQATVVEDRIGKIGVVNFVAGAIP